MKGSYAGGFLFGGSTSSHQTLSVLKAVRPNRRRTADWKAHQDRRGLSHEGEGMKDIPPASCPLPPAVNVAEASVSIGNLQPLVWLFRLIPE